MIIKLLKQLIDKSPVFQGKLALVAKRQYIQTIRKPSFWVATLLFPAFIILVSFVSGYSAEQTERKVLEDLENIDRVYVYDDLELINPALLVPPLFYTDDKAGAIDQVRDGEADALFVYSGSSVDDVGIGIYSEDAGLLSKGKFNSMADTLVKQSILMVIQDPQKIALFNAQIPVENTYFKDGTVLDERIEDYIVPVVALVLYFMLVFMGTNFLLSSVSEEKENRMMEIVLTSMNSRELIWGKIVGLVAIVVTQLLALVAIAAVGLFFTYENLPIQLDFSAVSIDPMNIVLSVFYILAGFLMIATVMVGVGAAMPTYREAQQFSSIFIIIAIMPIYFITLIVADPNGVVAMITSYIPLTSPLVLLARSALNALPLWEGVIGVIVNIVYVVVGFIISFKLFEIGSLQYNQKISFLPRTFFKVKNSK
jgi:ABC-2 type transport system permease protein